ncbi:DEXDc+HELICc [Cryptosporidium xiaoi]|uniref:DEXDc+HELICc n=1 Tax=Cryptosporidium xiaoi TaxID=659607 RepID=A0AAV9YB88_9CRYT
MNGTNDVEMSDLDLSLKLELDMYTNDITEYEVMNDSNDYELDINLIGEIENNEQIMNRLDNEELELENIELYNGNDVFMMDEIRVNSIHNIGLDIRLVKYYCSKGLESLYEWQYECITRPGVLNGKNLVYSAPTSGGKTLVSELLMYKRVLETGRGALVVFPFVSLVSEKRDSYYKVGGDICGLKVSEFHHGSKSPLFETYDIGVATIEKANSIINYYIEHGDLFKRLSVIVVDELHLLGDDQRGYILEVMLTKIRLLSGLFEKNDKNSIQIIGMSATLPNLIDIGNWLDAVVYQSNYRPVPLKEHIVLNGRSYLKPENNYYGEDDNQCVAEKLETSALDGSNEDKLGIINKWKINELYLKYDSKEFNEENIGLSKWKYPQVNMKDLLILGWDSLKRGESVLVFCPTKYSVETTALFYARCLKKSFYEGINLEEMENKAIAYNREIEAKVKQIDKMRMKLVNEIISSSSDSNKKSKYNENLLECIKCGIGYHHSGLSNTERKIVEKGYRNGILSLLTATSTLAAGVNLPSKRVIFRGINIGKTFLTCVDYKQMSGRAGRVGQKSPYGESFILVNYNTENKYHADINIRDSEQIRTAIELLVSDMSPLKSTFYTNINGLTRLILEILAVIRENTDCIRYACEGEISAGKRSILNLIIDSTLMHHQKRFQNRNFSTNKDIRDSNGLLKNALEYLINNGMVVQRSWVGGEKNYAYMLVGEDYILDHLCTNLGRSIVASGLSPSTGCDLNKEMCENMLNTLPNDLTYMAFQVTPIPNKVLEGTEVLTDEGGNQRNKQTSCIMNSPPLHQSQAYYRIDWENLYEIVKNMGTMERQSIVKLGFDLEVIFLASQIKSGNLPPKLNNDINTLVRYQRLYASNILKLLFCGVSVDEITSKYKFLNLRDIQQLYTNSLTFCVSCITFTQCMNYWSLNLVFQSYLKRIQSIVLHDEYYYSSLFSRENALNVDRSIKKLTSSLNGFSNISAIEVKNSYFSIKTLNQFLVVPRKSIVYLINNKLYSGNAHTLQFVSQYVDQIFEDQINRGKKVPFYNKKKSLFNMKNLKTGSYNTNLDIYAENNDNSNIKAKMMDESQIVEEKLLSLLNNSKGCENILSSMNDNEFKITEKLELTLQMDNDDLNQILSTLNQNENIDISDIQGKLEEEIEMEEIDWEERLSLWSASTPSRSFPHNNDNNLQ